MPACPPVVWHSFLMGSQTIIYQFPLNHHQHLLFGVLRSRIFLPLYEPIKQWLVLLLVRRVKCFVKAKILLLVFDNLCELIYKFSLLDICYTTVYKENSFFSFPSHSCRCFVMMGYDILLL